MRGLCACRLCISRVISSLRHASPAAERFSVQLTQALTPVAGAELTDADELEDRAALGPSPVCLVTADFAMQNVALQMGLRLVAPGGLQIRRLSRWALRCGACFKVCQVLPAPLSSRTASKQTAACKRQWLLGGLQIHRLSHWAPHSASPAL